jgi:CHAD domain-containing protein
MAYRLSIDDDVASSVRACAREQLADAVRWLERADEDPVVAVHEARKDIKKTRALLRLVRPTIGKRVYRRENDALREIGLALSGMRDADVLVQTTSSLAEHATGRLPVDVFEQLGVALAREVAERRNASDEAGARAGPAFDGVIEALRAAELRVERWPLDGVTWTHVLAGAARAYARGGEALDAARAPARLAQAREGPLVPPAAARARVARHARRAGGGGTRPDRAARR